MYSISDSVNGTKPQFFLPRLIIDFAQRRPSSAMFSVRAANGKAVRGGFSLGAPDGVAAAPPRSSSRTTRRKGPSPSQISSLSINAGNKVGLCEVRSVGGNVEAVDEQSADVICRIIDRSHDLVAAFAAEPIRRRGKQRIGHRLVVNRFEKTEAPNIRLMERVVLRIVARHDSADDFAAGARQKKRGIAVLIKRVFPAEILLRSSKSGGTHAGSFVINSPGNLDEGVALRTRSDLGDFDLAARRNLVRGAGSLVLQPV